MCILLVFLVEIRLNEKQKTLTKPTPVDFLQLGFLVQHTIAATIVTAAAVAAAARIVVGQPVAHRARLDAAIGNG